MSGRIAGSMRQMYDYWFVGGCVERFFCRLIDALIASKTDSLIDSAIAPTTVALVFKCDISHKADWRPLNNVETLSLADHFIDWEPTGAI